MTYTITNQLVTPIVTLPRSPSVTKLKSGPYTNNTISTINKDKHIDSVVLRVLFFSNYSVYVKFSKREPHDTDIYVSFTSAIFFLYGFNKYGDRILDGTVHQSLSAWDNVNCHLKLLLAGFL